MKNLKNLLLDAKAGARSSDGTLEIALSLAGVSPDVTVTVDPFTINPPDLFLKTFADVGLSPAGMTGFKANLQHLLPQIATNIALLPEDPGADIGDVAELIRLWLLSA